MPLKTMQERTFEDYGVFEENLRSADV